MGFFFREGGFKFFGWRLGRLGRMDKRKEGLGILEWVLKKGSFKF